MRRAIPVLKDGPRQRNGDSPKQERKPEQGEFDTNMYDHYSELKEKNLGAKPQIDGIIVAKSSGSMEGDAIFKPPIKPHDDLSSSSSSFGREATANTMMYGKGSGATTLTTFHSRVEDMKRDWNEFWFPSHVPPGCQLFRRENIAIPLCYLLIGVLQGLAGPLINVLPLDLGASEAQQVTVAILMQLPASFKLFFGFVSDTMPVGGYRRKSYMVLGWFIASCAILFLLSVVGNDLKQVKPAKNANCFSSSQAGAAYQNQNNNNNNNNNNNGDDGDDDGMKFEDGSKTEMIRFLALCFLVFSSGVWMADVMADALVAEKAKLEPSESRGSLQSTCYSYRFFGVMCAVPVSTYLYSAQGPYYVICLLAILPITVFPSIYTLEEVMPMGGIRPVADQCMEIWHTVCSRATWQPMGFVFLYNMLQVSNAAGKEFSRTVLHFSSCQLNLMYFCALLLLYMGILTYKYFWIQSSWRTVYMVTTVIGLCCGGMQLMLINGRTLGLPPFWFAVGSHSFSEFVEGVQFLPVTIMMVHLCPVGSEGASYALFTSVKNTGLTLSAILSTSLLGIWDVSKEALAEGDLTGMVKLTCLATAIQFSGILYIGWLPHSKEELAKLGEENDTSGGPSSSMARSKVGGFVFLAVTFLAIAYTITSGMMNIFAPGWMGES
ncbi:hypothetical protein ACA910_015818 [Epithemia clementina (nom. ined.)]